MRIIEGQRTAARRASGPSGRLAAAIVFLSLMAVSASAAAAPMSPPEQVPPSAPYLGAWSGSRLQCKKDESGPVKCGTPVAFRIVFRNDGTGSCSGSDFPREFLYRQAEGGKMTLTSLDKSKTYELFDFKVESEFLSFQHYYYPTGGTQEGEDYIHYVFDLARE